MPSIPKIGYYVMMRHLRNQGSLQNKFLFYFDSQVYPTILPGYAQFVPDYDLYLNTELDFKILTEDDLILTQDVFLKYN